MAALLLATTVIVCFSAYKQLGYGYAAVRQYIQAALMAQQ